MKVTQFGKKQIWRILTVIFAFLLTLVSSAFAVMNQNEMFINGALNITNTKVVQEESSEEKDLLYYKSEFSSQEEMYEHNKEIAHRVEAEGAVLLKNEGNTLPLSKGSKVSLFSRSSTSVVCSGAGSGAVDTSVAPSMKEAFEEDGKMAVNPTLWQAYLDYTATLDSPDRLIKVILPDITASVTYRLLEAPMSVYTTDVRSSYEAYNDAAIVTITRVSGEGASDAPAGDFEDGSKYLALQDIEHQMLQEVTDNFDTVIVLINSSNAMELGWIDEYNIDAALWIGGVGQEGLYAVADILVGNVNPSGKLSDTYATDSFSSPAMQNADGYTYSNADELDAALAPLYGDGQSVRYNKYRVYQEGIYVGYKYYETRYEDMILGGRNADSEAGTFASKDGWSYADEVVYPFGYGLSYTQFKQELKNVRETDEGFQMEVEVTNIGEEAGKSVVQIYAQQPYTQFDIDNGIEKASVQLVGFTKTDLIEAGNTQTVTVSIDKYDFATYDSKVNKGYILEAGDYYLSLGDDAHDALNNILAAKNKTGMTDAAGNHVSGDKEKTYQWILDNTDTASFAYSYVTNKKVTNLFDSADLNYYGDLVEYLTRSDWNTFPAAYDTLTATDEMIEDLHFNYEQSDNTDTSIFKQGYIADPNSPLMLVTLRGTEYEDPLWDTLIDQMTLDELLTVVARACKDAIPSIGKPFNYLKDGTQTIAGDASSGGGLYYEKPVGEAMLDTDSPTELPTVAYPAEVVMASTFNVDLLEEVGEAFGEDGLWSLVHHHYAPGANIHRTPYSGRNYEYYSEDAFLTATMAASEVKGQTSKGLIPYIKHFALYDNEKYRLGIGIYCEEQAMREIYFRGFEYAITESKVPAIMGSYVRLGCTWTGASKELMTDLLVGEWGYNGIVDTDAALFSFMEARSGVMAGTTDFAVTNNWRSDELMKTIETDADLYAAVREAAHRNLYVIANSAEMNGYDSDMQIVKVLTWWQITCIAAIAVLGVLFAGSAVMLTIQTYKKEEK